ncbi:MAG: cytochrome P450, partial [Pseudomonadota bacterium]
AETDDAAGEAMLTHEELLTMLFLLLFAGHETTVHLISSGAYSLCQHGTNGHFGPDRDTAAKLTAVNELMRYCSPVEMTETRYARTPTEIGGHTLNAGDTVISFFSAANHDPTVFDDPSTLRLDRHPNPQLGFGGGAHFCLGAQLARIEAAIAFSELFGGDSKLALVAPDAAPSWAPAPAMHGHQSLMVRFSG